jgi:ABC-type uncharacterized transport system permease subunit
VTGKRLWALFGGMSMLSRVSIVCFAGSYAVALALELTRLLFRSGVRGAVMLGFAGAGLFAHTVYLFYRIAESYQAAGSVSSPLSSKQEWYLIAAWLLAIVYLYLTCYHPRVPFGLFVLPLVLGLIAVAAFAADPRPSARESASTAWGMVHGISILLATVAVLVGFAAGLMFLGQDRRLKSKAPPGAGLRLPSLELLQQINSRTLVIALIMMGLGIVSGMVLNLINRGQGERPLLWNDPVVVSSLLMFGWLMLSSGIGVVYRPVREGRKVAYLTVVSFVFLAIALWSVLSNATRHLERLGQTDAPASQGPAVVEDRFGREAGPGQTVTVLTPARGDRA